MHQPPSGCWPSPAVPLTLCGQGAERPHANASPKLRRLWQRGLMKSTGRRCCLRAPGSTWTWAPCGARRPRAPHGIINHQSLKRFLMITWSHIASPLPVQKKKKEKKSRGIPAECAHVGIQLPLPLSCMEKRLPRHAGRLHICWLQPHPPHTARVPGDVTLHHDSFGGRVCPAFFLGSISWGGVKVGFLLLVSSLKARFAWGG